MGQTHDDYDSNSELARLWKESQMDRETPLDALRRKASEMTARGENLITAGAPHERDLLAMHRGGFNIRRLPDDPLALRISIGEAHDKDIESAYLVFRGDPKTITALLRRALAALDGAF